MKQEFKVGDKVYCPELSNEICHITSGYDLFPGMTMAVGKINAQGIMTIYANGKMDRGSFAPSVFRVTPENHELLCKLYGVEFEAPPKPKSPKEVIQAMLESGKWHLVNYRIYGNAQQALNDTPKNKVITKSQYDVIDFKDYFNKYAYCNVEVIDPKTGKVIIDYIDGEIVTE